MTWYRFFITIIVLLSFHQGVTAQRVVRVELPAEEETDVYDLIPCGEQGVVTLYETEAIRDSENKKWEFALYDTLLNRVWISEVPVLFGTEFQAYHYENNTLHLLFLNTRKVKTSIHNIHIISVSLPDGDQSSIVGSVEDKAIPVGFTVAGNTAVVAVNTSKDIGEVYFFDLVEGSFAKTILHLQDQTLVNYLRSRDDGSSVDVAAVTYSGRRQSGMVIFHIDLSGNILSTTDIAPNTSDRFLNNARLIEPGDGSQIVLGTYNSSQGRIPTSEDYDINQSAGMFAARIKNGIQQEINFYNFLDFENLRTGMSRKEYYKMQRRSKKDSEEFSLNYSLLVHGIDTVQNDYIILLETFYPDYRTVSDIAYDYWGRPIPQSYTVFEGYRYISAIIAGFNEDAELAWDNSMEIYNVSAYDLDYKVDYLVDSTDLVIFYNEGGKITFKAIERDIALTGLVHTELELPNAGDKLIETGYDNMTPWYNGYFLCYGYQKIRNNSLIDKSRRTVFYFSKIAFD
jgi:hypothetical protein